MNNQNIVDSIDAIENRLKVLGIFENVVGVRVKPRPVVWSFKDFDIVLKPYRGFVLTEDGMDFYQGYGVVFEIYDNKSEFPLPVKYYNTVDNFVSKFTQDDISYLRRKTEST